MKPEQRGELSFLVENSIAGFPGEGDRFFDFAQKHVSDLSVEEISALSSLVAAFNAYGVSRIEMPEFNRLSKTSLSLLL